MAAAVPAGDDGGVPQGDRAGTRTRSDWIPNVSPITGKIHYPDGSQKVCISSPDERQELYDQFEPFFEAGVRTFMISFDDSGLGGGVLQRPGPPTHPEDARE